MARLFIAIAVPEAVKQAIEAAQRDLRESIPAGCVRWTRREQFHLTLRFLGNVPIEQIDALHASLRNACRPVSAIRLHAQGIGFFPNIQSPRVIWVGVHEEKGLLSTLQSIVETAAGSFTDEKPERKFTGHVTLGRATAMNRAQRVILTKPALALSDRRFGEWDADHVEIIRSELSSQGSRYTTVASVPLA